MNKLTEIYYKLVKARALDIEKVPAKYREDVREKLKRKEN